MLQKLIKIDSNNKKHALRNVPRLQWVRYSMGRAQTLSTESAKKMHAKIAEEKPSLRETLRLAKPIITVVFFALFAGIHSVAFALKMLTHL